MILLNKKCNTGIEYCVVLHSPYYGINMLSIDNKAGESWIFIIFKKIFSLTHANFQEVVIQISSELIFEKV